MIWKKVRRLGSGLGLAAMVGLAAACGGDSPTDPAPTTGSVQVTTATTGVDLDADGYMIAVDGGPAQASGINATITVSNVTAAAHSVTLSGLAANCSVSGSNPRTVTVTGGGTAALTFAVACASLTGGIRVGVNATGANLPVSTAVTIDGTQQANNVFTNSTLDLGPYAIGDHSVEIEVAPNCTLTGSNPRTVTVPSGSSYLTVEETFELTCVSTEGGIRVGVNATGANLPVSTAVTIDGTQQANNVFTNSTLDLGPYAIGDHSVEIEVAPNCTLAGSNPRTVTVPSGSSYLTVEETFELTCVSTEGGIRVGVNATGANLPVSTAVTIDGTQQANNVFTNSTLDLGPYAIGDHSVEIEVAPNCTLTGSNPRTVTVPSGSSYLTVEETFELTCVSTEGGIRVGVNATGANLPVSTAVTIDGTQQANNVFTNSTLDFGPYAIGDHSVEIEVAPNCTLTGSNPRTVTVPSGSSYLTVEETFELTCVSTEGGIRVGVNATGANLPVSTAVTIDGTQQANNVFTNSTLDFGPYAIGDHSVEIEVAPNCTLTGSNPRTVTVPSGSSYLTVEETFELTCS